MAVTELLSSEEEARDDSSDTLLVATVEAEDSMACLLSLAVEVLFVAVEVGCWTDGVASVD